ncbi:MAG: alpha/beta hydrolase family protein [Nocardioidaceae bacterium]
MSEPDDLQRLVHDLLDIRVWTGFDIDPDGRVLAGTDDLGSLQIVEIAPDGTRTPLTDLPSRCSGRYLPGTRVVVVEHDNGGDEHMQLSVLDLSEPLGRPATLGDLQPLVADPEHMHNVQDVTETSLVYSTNRRNDVDMDVVVRDLASGDERVVFDEGGYVAETVVSHGGSRVVVNRLSLLPNSMVVGVAGAGGSRTLTDQDELAFHQQVAWSAGDEAIVMSSNHGREFTAVVSLTLDGEWRTLVENPEHDLLVWTAPDGAALLVGTLIDGAVTFAVHEADGTRRCGVELPPSAVTGVRWAADASRILVALTSPTDPGSLYRVDAATGAAAVVVDGREAVPAALRDRLTIPTVHRVPTPDGEQVPCFLYAAAPGAEPGLAGASVVHVHGGPEAAAHQIFNPLLQALSLLGFAVLVPNVRGSTGYGKRWYSLDDVEKRLDSVADLAALHDWLPSQGLDADRSALWGGSYGGYMVLAGVSMQPERWAAGVDIVGMSSLVTFLENTSGYRRAFREREYGSLEHHRDLLEKASPITYLDQMVAPLFVIHGANDPRVPLSEAKQIKAALDARGVECELRVYDDEGHGLAKRVNRLDAFPAAMAFLSRVLMTQERRGE